ncbi:hypothetical protein NBO_662g0001 [Nosema bombycis CQ1]|uniref:Uncharacterized protein n=1 Tax=Nosema bombycis (strain CQ1 / CVCC 102059) TaxID=578461 RepID=R0M1M3_NOSB1|nr:hypothetical protein NBO_662g0001 [Nosema bombycis CQ1]|eukprot:EOB11899.1 hypothetical protein NBO_662g0001 [Nosema bombycis CQ1]
MTITDNIIDDLLIRNLKIKNQHKPSCNNISYTCLIDEMEIDRSNVPENLFEFLDFNENIIRITKEFWDNLANLAEIKGNIHDPQKCYSFINPKNCVTISSFFFNPYRSFFRLQRRYGSLKYERNLFKLKKEALLMLKFYLKDILPIFDTEIKKLEISIISYDENDNHTTVLYKYLNSERNIERQIIRYLANMRNFVSNFNVRSNNGNEPVIKRKLNRVLKKTYDKVKSRIRSLKIGSTSNLPKSSIHQEITTPINVSETTQKIGCNDLNLTTIPSTTDILSSTKAFLTDNTALASINVHLVMAISAILLVILGCIFGLLFIRRKRFEKQKIIHDDYDLVIDHS